MSDDRSNPLQIFWNLLPPVAIYNLIKRTNEHGANDVHMTAIGWQPDESYTRVEGEEYTKVIRKASK